MSRRNRKPAAAPRRRRSESPPFPRSGKLSKETNDLTDIWTARARRIRPDWTRNTISVLYRHWLTRLEETYTEAYGKNSYFDLTKEQQEYVHQEAEQRAKEKVDEIIKQLVKIPRPQEPVDHPDAALIADIREEHELLHETPPPQPTNAAQLMREFLGEEHQG